MFAFVLYAILVWYLAIRWRRRLIGLVSLAAGLAGIAFIGYFHLLLSRWTDGAIYLPLLQIMLYPYGLLVGGAGLFMVCLPRRRPTAYCKACSYDLAGLDPEIDRCPECGSTRLFRPDPAPADTDAAAAHTADDYFAPEIAAAMHADAARRRVVDPPTRESADRAAPAGARTTAAPR